MTQYRTLNPATEKLIREYPALTWKEAEKKAAETRAAYDLHAQGTQSQPLSERLKKVQNLSRLLRERTETFASLITEEMGKPIVQARYEIDKCSRGCDYYLAHAAEHLREEMVKTEAGKSYVRFGPLVVILGIMPWNFPFWQVFRFAVPALLAGNTILVKPAPCVPASSLAIEALFREAGFAAGELQSLFLTDEEAARLIESSWIQGVSLTGSDRAGSAVGAVAGRSLKKMVFELGGSDPFVVFEDADLDLAVSQAVRSRPHRR